MCECVPGCRYNTPRFLHILHELEAKKKQHVETSEREWEYSNKFSSNIMETPPPLNPCKVWWRKAESFVERISESVTRWKIFSMLINVVHFLPGFGYGIQYLGNICILPLQNRRKSKVYDDIIVNFSGNI